ncbi:MAG: BrnT family toxin [Acidobacteriota bacterium]
MNYEWDEVKAQSNLKNHHISFEEATLIFEDVFALELFDDEHSTINEQRFIRLGLANDKVLFVVYTVRGENPEVYRLISARSAEKDEEKIYWEERNEQ